MPEGFRIANAYVDVEIDQKALDSGIAQVQAKLEAIRDRAISVGVDQKALDAAIAEIQMKMADIRTRSLTVGINQAELDQQLAEMLAKIRAISAQFNVHVDLEGLPEAVLGTDALFTSLHAAQAEAEAMNRSFDVTIAEIAAIGINAGLARAQIAAAHEAAAGVAGELRGVNLILGAGGGGWQANWLQWVHWIMAGGAELASIVVPAAIALGSAIADAAQGAQMVQQHMKALYTTTEATANMFHTTMGQALGIGDALQKAQNMANPLVYEALGAAIDMVKRNAMGFAQTGLEVIRIFDTFLARVQLDLQKGGATQIKSLLAGMVPDLVKLGQVFGNLGHAVINLAGDMPGLAHVLLDALDALSRFIEWFTTLPRWLVEAVIVFEEFYRWGGLFVTLFARMAGAISAFVLGNGIPLIGRFGEYFQTIFKSVGVIVGSLMVRLGEGIGKLKFFGTAAEDAGSSVAKAGESVASAAGSMGPGLALGIGVGLIALGFLTYKLLETKSAAQQLV
ncbi:MAG: hypothetical protein ACYCOU_25485, partial [Sulfobacillus sp.]